MVVLALRAVGSSLAQILAHVTVSLLANVIAIIISLPVLLVIAFAAASLRSFSIFPLGIILLLGVLPNPALCGVQNVARLLAHDDLLRVDDVWGGFKQYWRPALALWLPATALTLVIIFNLAFYAQLALKGPGPGLAWIGLTIIWLNLLLFWVALHLYVFPLLMEQENKSPFLIYRNAAVMVLTRPAFTLIVFSWWFATLLVSSFTGLAALIGLVLGALIQQNAARRLVLTFPPLPKR